MKKRFLLFCSICMICLGGGCGQETGKQNEPPKTISVTFTSMPKENVAKPTKTVAVNVSDGFLIPFDIEIDSNKCNTMNRKLTGESDSGASLFCLDENETIYFVNQNMDNYLYCRKDGVTELAVALPVKEVYPWEGRIYFMIAEKEGEKEAGDIYEYIPVTKQVNLVYALGRLKGGENHKMTVNEQGIQFHYSETITKEEGMTTVEEYSYILAFGAAEPVKDTKNLGKAGWGDYYFSYVSDTENSTESEKLCLVSRIHDEVLLTDIGELQYCVVGDTLYSIELGSSAVSYVHLQTQKKSLYNFRIGIIDAHSYLKDDIERVFGEGKEEIHSFTTTENGKIIWVTDGTYLYRMDSRITYAFQIKTPDVNCRIETLYTDGRSVYGLYAPDQESELQLVRFCTEVLTQKRVDLPAITEVEYLVSED